MEIKELLDLTIKSKASDLHLIAGISPTIRVDGFLNQLQNFPPLVPSDIETMVFSLLTPEQKELLITNKELDFSFGFGEGVYGDLGRFRINAYFQRGYLSAAFRFLPPKIQTIEDLKLPKVLHEFAQFEQGLILVCGPTGHGKSTTLASIINEINLNRSIHILTIEDPIEYVYPKGKSIISQREIGIDTHSWAMALRSSLREDPNVLLVGEMRDPETMAAAITVAETGHLVFSTLHTNSAAQTVDRILDSFPSDQHSQIQNQLAFTLRGIISQRLLPKITEGRVVATEILTGTSAVASNIREGKIHLLDSIIQTGAEAGMITLERSLAQLVLGGEISLETAKMYALHEDELLRMVG